MINKMEVEFVDGQQMNKENPTTFEVPSQEELSGLKEGVFVKVATGGERFWVQIKNVDADEIVGIIDNDLVRTEEHGLSYSDVVTFQKRNVLSIFEG